MHRPVPSKLFMERIDNAGYIFEKYDPTTRYATVRCKKNTDHVRCGSYSKMMNRLVRENLACEGCKRVESNEGCYKRLEDYVKSKGGEILSGTYKSCKSKFTIRCSKIDVAEHIWTSTYSCLVNSGGWCLWCFGRKIHIDHARALAKSRGGVCLDESITGCMQILTWKCKRGHINSTEVNIDFLLPIWEA